MIEIPSYEYDDIPGRLRALGLHVELLSPYSTYSDFDRFDAILLPAGWAWYGGVLNDRASQFLRFVSEGGGLILEQPNPSGTVIPMFLPYSVSFAPGTRDLDEWPPLGVKDHFITGGVPLANLPATDNIVAEISAEYDILLVSAKSKFPTLFTLEFENGRVVAYSSTVSDLANPIQRVSDQFVTQVFDWVTKRDTP